MDTAEKRALIDELLGSLNSDHNRVRLVQAESPLGIDVQANAPGCPMTVEVFPPHGRFMVQGVRSFNLPGEISISEILGPDGQPRSAAAFDSASYSLDHGAFKNADPAEHLAYYKAPWGEISRDHPLGITCVVIGTPSLIPFLRWTLYGTLIIEGDVEQPKLVSESKAPEPAGSTDAQKPATSLWPPK